MVAQAVRMVIWDLDETFWKGTFSEGGVREYVHEHHNIVIELARRGIMSSICSKNDPKEILPFLEEKGISEYFIFPSIAWEPKGVRLAKLIETVQLRARTILFIDDNPNNRAEAAVLVPGLQIADETFIPKMLTDRRFEGKDDSHFTRLKQYKLLEARKRDEEAASGGNEEFLRSCDIRVSFEYDIEAHIDRAVELINRTNQLNYTKRRLPDEMEAARRELRQQLQPFDRQAALIEVTDKHGDYGFVGFFLTAVMRNSFVEGSSNSHLLHFCFSCRTLGMLIEQWVYEFLGRPELTVIGEALTDLSVARSIDWIRQVQSMDCPVQKHPKIAPQIVVYGGCEAHIIGGYLNAYADKLDAYGNYAANGLFVRINDASIALDISYRSQEVYAAEAEILGLPLQLEAADFFMQPQGTLFVFDLSADAAGGWRRPCHKTNRWISVIEAGQWPGTNLFWISEGQLLKHLDENTLSYTCEQRQHILRVSRHLRENYMLLPAPSDREKVHNVRSLIARIPLGAKFIIAINHHECRHSFPSEEVVSNPSIKRYASLMRELAAEYPYVGVATVSDVIGSVHDMQDHGHYARDVYLRFAQRIVEVAATLEPRPDAPAAKEVLARQSAAKQMQIRREDEARELVLAGYQCLLRREPDPSAETHFQCLVQGLTSPADFLRALVRSSEFDKKWASPGPEATG